MGKKNGLADPVRSKCLDSADKQLLRVVIETPRGAGTSLFRLEKT
jgi:hypothetical protein